MLIKMLKKTFLTDLFYTDKTLFVVVTIFIAAQLFFTWKGVESFPFLNWGMYSGKAQNANETEIIQLKIDKQNICISCLPDVQGAIVQSTFNWFTALNQNNFTDTVSKVFDKRFKGKISNRTYSFLHSKILNNPINTQKYPEWLLQYLADMRLVENPVIEGKKLTLRYSANSELDTIKSEEVFHYVANF